MSTDARPATRTGTKHRWWIAMLVAVLGLAAGLGLGWLLFNPSSMNPQAEALARDYLAAWDAGDTEAVLAMMTADGIKQCPRGTFRAADTTATGLAADVEYSTRFALHTGPDVIMSNPEPPLRVLLLTSVASEGSSTDGTPGTSELTIVEDNGQLKIAKLVWTPL